MNVTLDNENTNFIFKLSEMMAKDNLNYIYRGAFEQHIIVDILSLTEKNIVNARESARIKKKVYNLMVESLQNITRHQSSSHELNDYGIFFIQNMGDRYYITTGNLIDANQIEALRSKLELINSLDKDALKDYYRKQLANGVLSEKGGAGLGFLDMARKSGNKFHFHFQPINDQIAYFYFRLQISSAGTQGTDGDNEEDDIHPLGYIADIHKLILEKNILLIYNNVFSEESSDNLLYFIKSQVYEAGLVEDEVYEVMVEMIQNIVQHATCEKKNEDAKPAIFFITERNNEYHLHSGNYIKTKDVERLNFTLENINYLDKKELNKLYQERIKELNMTNQDADGMGILGMRMRSIKKFDYKFLKHNDKHAFFTLEITVQH
jgi:hypothetical protein